MDSNDLKVVRRNAINEHHFRLGEWFERTYGSEDPKLISMVQHGATGVSLTLNQCVSNGHLEVVQFLQGDCNIRSFHDVEESLAAAAVKGHLEVVRLFDAQIQKSYPSEAFCNAARTGNMPMLKFLRSKPHDVNVYCKAIKDAFQGGHLQIAKVLVDQIKAHQLNDMFREEVASLHKDMNATIESGNLFTHDQLAVFAKYRAMTWKERISV